MMKVYNFLPTPPPIFEISYLEKEPDIYFLNDFEKNLCNFITDKRRYEWICSRYIVKKLVSTYLNIDFKSITILNDPNGKPFVIAGKDIFYISISHRNKTFAASFNRDFSPFIGIDIEFYEEKEKKFFADFMNDEELSCDSRRIIEIWSIKEALSKAIGRGASLVFKDINVKSDGSLSFSKNIECLLSAYKIDKIYYELIKSKNFVVSVVFGGCNG